MSRSRNDSFVYQKILFLIVLIHVLFFDLENMKKPYVGKQRAASPDRGAGAALSLFFQLRLSHPLLDWLAAFRQAGYLHCFLGEGFPSTTLTIPCSQTSFLHDACSISCL